MESTLTDALINHQEQQTCSTSVCIKLSRFFFHDKLHIMQLFISCQICLGIYSQISSQSTDKQCTAQAKSVSLQKQSFFFSVCQIETMPCSWCFKDLSKAWLRGALQNHTALPVLPTFVGEERCIDSFMYLSMAIVSGSWSRHACETWHRSVRMSAFPTLPYQHTPIPKPT